jgi:hypothetical protein
MAVRTPLKLDGSDLREMTTAEIEAIQTEAIRLYGLSPSVTLSVVGSGGNLGTMSDTRLIAGAGTTDTVDYDTPAETPDVSTTTVNYSKINQAYDTSEVSWTDATYSYPMYYDGSDLREMTATDFADTFIYPAIDTLTSGSTGTAQAGTYFISTSSSVAGATEVSGSSTPIFTDTRADASAYLAGSIPNTLDQPITITNYYLHRVNSASAAGHELPICYTKSGIDLQQTPSATFQTALEDMIRYYAAEIAGTKISYSINGTGNNRGTAMTDTRLDGSTYLTRFVDADDYRTQEVPSGTPQTISTYNLKITQV